MLIIKITFYFKSVKSVFTFKVLELINIECKFI